MPFVERDSGGAVIGCFAVSQPGFAEEWLEDAHPDIKAFDLARQGDMERFWRNGAFVLPCSIRDRHRDELELGIATTLTAEQFAELLAYIQQLRDWPQSELFPAPEHRPAPPSWYQSGE